ncbi:hypothetical protein CR513_06494, partial [Mucuna pruriens]
MRDMLRSITQIRFTNKIEKNFGFNIVHGKIQRRDFDHISCLLNKLDRLTLANIVLSTIPCYGMQTIWYSQYVCDILIKMDNKIKDFIWWLAKDSLTWNDIVKALKLLQDGFVLKIGIGILDFGL